MLAPFIAGAVIILGARVNKTLSMLLSIAAVAYGFTHSLMIFHELHANPTAYQANWDWFVCDSFKLTIGILVDNLASIMLIVVTAVSLLVQIYTHGYMRTDPGYARFYSYLSLFTGSMLGLVVATNLFQMYFFWELVGVCSYFLIGFWWYKPSAAAACLKAFVINRIGDFGFLVGILMLLAATMGFWSSHADHGLLMFNDSTGSGIDLSGAIRWALTDGNQLTPAFLTVISLLIFMGPMAKSAQVPLHTWLPDAMEGPTPISALIHAATMVAAGVYLVARAYPLWLNWADPANPTTVEAAGLSFVAWVGTITALIAAIIACSQYDIKRILAWSTVSQLGYMFAGLGVGAYTGGMFHLFNHAFFKAMLFLCSGAVIHALHDEQDVRNMGGLRKFLPITFACCLIGTISISGVPMFSGFFSKDEIIGGAWDASGGRGIAWILILTAGLTAFYMFRMLFMTFFGTYRGKVEPHHEKLDPVTAPLIALAIPSIISGYLGTNMEFWKGSHDYTTPFGNFLYFQHPHFPVINWTPVLLSTSAALIGIALAGLVYITRSIRINDWMVQNARPLYNLSFNKFYFDNLYMWVLTRGILPFFAFIWSWVDMYIVDNIVNLTKTIALGSGETLRLSENGRGQYYAMIIFACVAGITLFVYITRN